MFNYQTSVHPVDEGVAIHFEPSLGSVRQLIDVSAHFNVSCGEYFRYAEDHPMTWRKGHYVTELKKDTLLEHCSDQSDLVGYFGGAKEEGAVKVTNPKGDESFATFFMRDLEPYSTYNMMVSETPCEEKEGGKGASAEGVSNDMGEVYQVSKIDMPKSSDKDTVYYARLSDSNQTLSCTELEPRMPDATLFYAFKYTIEVGDAEEVECNTRVFEITDKNLWTASPTDAQTPQVPTATGRQQPNSPMRPRQSAIQPQQQTMQPVQSAMQPAQSTRQPRQPMQAMPNSPMVRLAQAEAARMPTKSMPNSPMMRLSDSSRMQSSPESTTSTNQESTTNNVRVVDEGESCSTLYGRMCRQGLNCVFSSPTDQLTPQTMGSMAGTCQRRDYAPGNVRTLTPAQAGGPQPMQWNMNMRRNQPATTSGSQGTAGRQIPATSTTTSSQQQQRPQWRSNSRARGPNRVTQIRPFSAQGPRFEDFLNSGPAPYDTTGN